jgi:hypothetical protein
MLAKGRRMAKYDRLGKHLSALDRGDRHTLTFDRIEAILGFPLPKSARQYQAWWANQIGGGHAQANAWLDSGWRTEALSLAGRRVTFKPVATPRAARGVRRSKPDGLTIHQAKRAVAAHYGVGAEQVEISIKG